jgi:hypothetical protein
MGIIQYPVSSGGSTTFTIDSLYKDNNQIITQYITTPALAGSRIATSASNTSIERPVNNVSFSLVSNSNLDFGDINVTYIDTFGTENIITVTLNGTSPVVIDDACVMINYVAPRTTFIGPITVKIDTLGNSTFSNTIGSLINGIGWMSSLYLVPNTKKLMVTHLSHSNQGFTQATFSTSLCNIQRWRDGRVYETTNASDTLFWNGVKTTTDDILNNSVVTFNEGDLVFIRVNASADNISSINFQYIIFDA